MKNKKIKKKNLYHKFVFEKLVSFYVILSDIDLGKMHTLGKQQSYITVEDYLIHLIESNYEIIDVDDIVKVKNRNRKYDHEQDKLIMHQLVHPKLLKSDNSVSDVKQATLDEYLK